MWHGWQKQKVCDECGHKHKTPARFCEQCGCLVALPPELYPTERKRKKHPHLCEPAYTPDNQDEKIDGGVLP